MRGGRAIACSLSLSVGACAAAGAGQVDDAGMAALDAEADDADAVEDASSPEQDASPVSRALVHSALWQPLSGEDPFTGDAAVDCPPGTFGEEILGGELVFFVHTELCPSLTVAQPSRVAVHAGDVLQVRAFHFPLNAPEGATAQLVLSLGDVRLWERELAIPSPAGELVEEVRVEGDHPTGTTVQFHVHNHGANEYVLIGVDVL